VLLRQCLLLLSSGGKIFLSVNLRRGTSSVAQTLEKELNLRVTDLGSRIEDEDFRGKKIPKAFKIMSFRQ